VIATILLAVGLVLCVEGLVFALAPSRLDELMNALKQIPPDTLRLIGLGALALGVIMIWLAKSLGA
jgi:hypothetical protein